MRLQKRVALVTAMASGIGQAIALRFAAEGAAIIGVDVDEKGGASTREQILSHGGRILFHRADVGSQAEVQAAVEAGLREFGKIDVLANVVGIASEAPCHKMELSDWERIIRVNLTSMFLASKYVLPGMIERKYGSIVNMASVQGLLGLAGYPHYAASKGGVISFDEANGPGICVERNSRELHRSRHDRYAAEPAGTGKGGGPGSSAGRLVEDASPRAIGYAPRCCQRGAVPRE